MGNSLPRKEDDIHLIDEMISTQEKIQQLTEKLKAKCGNNDNDDINRNITTLTKDMKDQRLRLQEAKERIVSGNSQAKPEMKSVATQCPETSKQRKISVNVQLLQRDHGELMETIFRELKSWLQSIYSSENIELNLIPIHKPEAIRNNLTLLVTCFNASRLGADAEAAINGTQGLSRTGLLIFHHKDVNQVSHTPSEKVLTGQKFDSISIFDFVFLTKMGIYSCKLNDDSLAKLLEFINHAIDETACDPSLLERIVHKFQGK